jgi:acetyl esterase
VLDPQAQALLNRLGEGGGKPIRTLTPALARLGARRFIELFGPPEPVAKVDHRFVPGPTADLPVRIYTPADAAVPAPALVYFHGSGFVISNIEIFDAPSRALANRTGCVVVAVNYQKSPEHKFPVPFDDAYAATTWVVEHAAELGLDPTRVAVIGDSAGGTLAAAVCLKTRDVEGVRLAAQILIHVPMQYGMQTASMVENAEGMMLESADMEWFATHYVRDAADATNPYAFPLAATSLAGLPPALVVTAEYDPLRDEGEQYADRLSQAGVPVSQSRYAGMIHGFYGMTAVLDAANELFDQIARYLHEVFDRRAT